MVIYEYICDSDNYHSFILKEDKEYETVLEKFDGRSLCDSWKRLNVKLYKTRYSGDFPHLTSHVPAFSKAAVDTLLPFIGNSVEVLPLRCDDYKSKQFYAINVIEVIDCLNYSKSEITRFSDGEIMFIDHPVFIEDAIHNKHIFKIKDVPLKSVFVSKDFRKAVENAGLKGLRLKQV